MKFSTKKQSLPHWVRCLGVVSLLLCTVPVLAVDVNGAFELDGDAFDNNNATGGPGGPVKPGDDWSTPPKPTGSATAFTGIVVDKNGLDNIFTGGGSKTPNLISQWQWKTSPPPPDKDNVTNAYAANYVVGGEQIIYFGLDLFATNGDAEAAFWFFQDDVHPVPEGATQGTFEGEHIDGDIYVAAKFSNGGTIANIAVYEWFLACNSDDKTPNVVGSCAADNIRIKVPLGPATCTSVAPSKIACAISNLAPVPSPWPYTPKTGPANIFPETSFFEGGINVHDLFGENKCFSSFAVTTGASTSFTATAKDFAIHSFDVCSVAVSKECVNDTDDDDIPEAIVYNVRGCGFNDGGGDININSLLNSIGGAPNYIPVDLAWYVPGSVDDGSGGTRAFDPLTDCDDAPKLKQAIDNGILVADVTTYDLGAGDALIYQFTETTASNAATDTVTLDADGTDGTDITDATATATCPFRTFAASLNVVKQCAADLVDAGDAIQVEINVQGTVCNTGEVTLTGLTLEDGSPAALGPVTLTPLVTTLTKAGTAGACTTYTGSYTPTSIPTGNICPFADQVIATAIAPSNSSGDNCELVGSSIECTATSNTATCELRAVDEDNDCSTGPLSPLPE